MMMREPEQYIGRPSNLSDAELFSLNYVDHTDQLCRLYIWTVIIFENYLVYDNDSQKRPLIFRGDTNFSLSFLWISVHGMPPKGCLILSGIRS